MNAIIVIPAQESDIYPKSIALQWYPLNQNQNK